MYETENWPFIQAKWFGVKRTGPVRLIVIHDMEFPERMDAAEVIARDFANRPASSKASAHICVDANSIVQCVKDSYIAYAAPGANHDGIQIELAGYAAQNLKQWMDEYGWMLLNRAADATAQYCLKYSIPRVKLTAAEVLAGKSGICGHTNVSEAFKLSSHTDPGAGFPWDFFIAAVRAFYSFRSE